MSEFDVNLPNVSDYYKEPKTDKQLKKDWNDKIFKGTSGKVVYRSSDFFWKFFSIICFLTLLTAD